MTSEQSSAPTHDLREEPLYDIRPSTTMESALDCDHCVASVEIAIIDGVEVPLCSAATGVPCTKAIRASMPDALAGHGALNHQPRRGTPWEKPSAYRPLIGLVAKQFPEERFLSLPAEYAPAIAHAGGVPVILPFIDDKEAYGALFSTLDGFVLTGGHDVSPALYGGPDAEDPEFATISQLTPERDALEYEILNYADAHDIPVLGICRGMQMINVYYGGSLYPDLATDLGYVKEDHWQTATPGNANHEIQVVAQSQLASILPESHYAVNSLHHQGVCNVAPCLSPCAHAENLVEGVEHPERTFILGVQWHPEFFAGTGTMGPLFAAFVEAARLRHNAR